MRILIDTREQAPFTFQGYDVDPETATLPVGDYSLPGFEDRAAIERKSLNDLIGCLMGKDRERFERELARGRYYDLFAVVVEASLADVSQARYRSDMKPQAALQSIITFQVRYRVPFVWAGNRTGAEYMTYSFLAKFLREIGESYKLAVKTQEKGEKAA
jgi:ERCC4-type nuclease